MKKHLLVFSVAIDIPRMCDYKRKQFLKEVDRRLKEAMKQHAAGQFEESCIDLSYDEGRIQ